MISKLSVHSLMAKLLLLPMLLVLLFFAADAQAAETQEKTSFRVLASTFPVFLLARNVCVDIPGTSVELLVPASAGCPHDFVLRPADLNRLENASVLVINGFGLEEFLEKFIEDNSGKIPVLDAGRNIHALEAPDHGGINPHTFAAPGQAALMVENIAAGLGDMDPENREIYLRNGKEYGARLEKLAKGLETVGSKAKNRGVALEHDSLAYLVVEAGLKPLEYFENASSAGRLARLEKELMDKKPALLIGDSQYPDRLLKTLSSETGIPFIRLDPCAGGPPDAPLNYYETVMNKNIQILEDSLD